MSAEFTVDLTELLDLAQATRDQADKLEEAGGSSLGSMHVQSLAAGNTARGPALVEAHGDERTAATEAVLALVAAVRSNAEHLRALAREFQESDEYVGRRSEAAERLLSEDAPTSWGRPETGA